MYKCAVSCLDSGEGRHLYQHVFNRGLLHCHSRGSLLRVSEMCVCVCVMQLSPNVLITTTSLVYSVLCDRTCSAVCKQN